MKVVKNYLIFSVFLFFYIVALSLLLRQCSLYQQAYQTLSMLLTNPSIAVLEEYPLVESETIIE